MLFRLRTNAAFLLILAMLENSLAIKTLSKPLCQLLLIIFCNFFNVCFLTFYNILKSVSFEQICLSLVATPFDSACRLDCGVAEFSIIFWWTLAGLE